MIGVGVGVVERTTGLVARTAGRSAGPPEPGGGLKCGSSDLPGSGVVEGGASGAAEAGFIAVVGVAVEASLATPSGDVFEEG